MSKSGSCFPPLPPPGLAAPRVTPLPGTLLTLCMQLANFITVQTQALKSPARSLWAPSHLRPRTDRRRVLSPGLRFQPITFQAAPGHSPQLLKDRC